MTITSVETLIFFVSIFGIIGAVRGPNREIWTVGGVTLTLIFLFFGGVTILEQLPVRIIAGSMALVGNQSASNSVSAQPLQAPWTYVWLWLATIALLALAFHMGQRFGKGKPATIGECISGFAMGTLNGLFISVFLFNESGLRAALSIQFPDSLLTRTSIVPLVLVGVAISLVAIATRRSSGPSSSSTTP